MSEERQSWLVIVPYMPRADRASGDRRLVAMLEWLAGHTDLHVVSLAAAESDDAAYIAALAAIGVQWGGYGQSAAVRALLRMTFSAVLYEFWFTTHRLLPIARAVQPQALQVIDSVDLHFAREREAARVAGLDPSPAEETRRQELAAYGKADAVVVVSAAEHDILHDLGVRSVVTVPNIVPILPRAVRVRAPRVLFIGSFTHAPNAAAVTWFGQAIWPRVRAAVPTAEWLIAGSSTPPEIRALHGRDGIVVAGFVPSTAAVLDDAMLSVAPLTYGAGMKGKVSEALAAGVPVVTTSWGAQGLESGAGTAYLLADDAGDFAAAVVRLLGDAHEQARLSRAGQALARARCSAEAAAPALQTLVSLAARRAAPTRRLGRLAALGWLLLQRGTAAMRRSGRTLVRR